MADALPTPAEVAERLDHLLTGLREAVLGATTQVIGGAQATPRALLVAALRDDGATRIGRWARDSTDAQGADAALAEHVATVALRGPPARAGLRSYPTGADDALVEACRGHLLRIEPEERDRVERCVDLGRTLIAEVATGLRNGGASRGIGAVLIGAYAERLVAGHIASSAWELATLRRTVETSTTLGVLATEAARRGDA